MTRITRVRLRWLLACLFILIGLVGIGVDSEYLVWTTLPACGFLLAGLYLLWEPGSGPGAKDADMNKRQAK